MHVGAIVVGILLDVHLELNVLGVYVEYTITYVAGQHVSRMEGGIKGVVTQYHVLVLGQLVLQPGHMGHVLQHVDSIRELPLVHVLQ